ncbi:MAG: hypothetical protein Tsb0010_09840 [Parvularculaceae bacterium]
MNAHMLAAAAIAGFVSTSANSAGANSAGPEYRDLVDRYYSQFQQPGFTVDRLLAFYAEDVEFSDPTFEIRVSGRDGVRSLYVDIGTERTNYRDIVWNIDRVLIDGNDVAINGRWSGVFYQCPFDVEFVTLWRLEGGLIAEQRDFFAASTFDRQVNWNKVAGRPDCDNAPR